MFLLVFFGVDYILLFLLPIFLLSSRTFLEQTSSTHLTTLCHKQPRHARSTASKTHQNPPTTNPKRRWRTASKTYRHNPSPRWFGCRGSELTTGPKRAKNMFGRQVILLIFDDFWVYFAQENWFIVNFLCVSNHLIRLLWSCVHLNTTSTQALPPKLPLINPVPVSNIQ